MNATCFRVVFPLLLVVLVLFSCNKDEERTKEMLQKHDWEQLDLLPWDTSYAEHKFFHTLRFNEDETYFMEINWSYYQLLLRLKTGVYELHSKGERIVFPNAIDTVVFDELGGNYDVFLSPWYILQLTDTLLVVKSEPGYKPPDNPGGYTLYEDETLYFRPKR
jgi:hypothetical protein